CARHFVAVVDRLEVDLLAVDAALAVDVGECVGDALPVGPADVGRGSSVVGDVADEDSLCGRRTGAEQDGRRSCGGESGFLHYGTPLHGNVVQTVVQTGLVRERIQLPVRLDQAPAVCEPL